MKLLRYAAVPQAVGTERALPSCFSTDGVCPPRTGKKYDNGPSARKNGQRGRYRLIEHLTLEMLAYGRQKPAFSHFVARIFKKILAEQLTHFIRYLL